MTRPAPIVALEGPSASGKSTVAARLAARQGWALIAEAVDRLDPAPSLDFRSEGALLDLETTLLEEDARRFEAACRIAARGTTVVCDTGFVGALSYTAGLLATRRCEPETYARLLAVARRLARARRIGLPDLSVYLAVPARVRADRAAGDPAHHPSRLRARHELIGRFEWDVFRPWFASAQPGRVAVVGSAGPAETVARAIERRAKATPRLRGRTLALARLLEGRSAADLASEPFRPDGTLKKGAPSARPPSA